MFDYQLGDPEGVDILNDRIRILAEAVWQNVPLAERNQNLSSTGWLVSMCQEHPDLFKKMFGNSVSRKTVCDHCSFSKTKFSYDWITEVTPSWTRCGACTLNEAILEHENDLVRPSNDPCPQCGHQALSIHIKTIPSRIIIFSDQCEHSNVKISWDTEIAWSDRVYTIIGRQHQTNAATLSSDKAGHFFGYFRDSSYEQYYTNSIGKDCCHCSITN